MDNQYSEFSDFFKKKLAETEGNSNNWDKPDAQVKETLLQRISTTAQTHVPYQSLGINKLIWGTLATTTILFLGVLGTYTLHLHNNNTQLTQKLQSQIMTSNCEDLNDIKQQHANQLAALLQEKTSIKQLNTAISTEKNRLEKQLKQQNNELRQQENELIQFNDRLHSLLSISEEKESGFQLHLKELNKQLNEQKNRLAHVAWQSKNWKLLYENVQENNVRLLKQDIPYYNYCETKDKDSLAISSVSKSSVAPSPEKLNGLSKYQSVLPSSIGKLKRKRFEAGYSYAFSQPDILIESKIINETGFEQTGYGYARLGNSGFNGLNVAYSPRPKLWLTTGIHFSSSEGTSYFNTHVRYANFIDSEVYTPESTIQNKLSYETKTEYAQTTYPISIEFNQGDLLDRDDMYIQIANEQHLNYLRIPLGFRQNFGKKRIQGFLSGGFRLNSISGTQMIEAHVKANNQIIETTYTELPQSLKTQFMDIYGGLGLDYQIFNHLHTRASFSLHQKLIKKNIYATFKTADFDVGLYYRF